MGRTFFYRKLSIAENEFPLEPQVRFPFLVTKAILVNDSENQVVTFSFQHPHIDGELLCTDGPIALDWISQGRLWFKTTGLAQMRVWAWRL